MANLAPGGEWAVRKRAQNGPMMYFLTNVVDYIRGMSLAEAWFVQEGDGAGHS